MADELEPKTNPSEEMGRSDEDIRDRVDDDEEFEDVEEEDAEDEDAVDERPVDVEDDGAVHVTGCAALHRSRRA